MVPLAGQLSGSPLRHRRYQRPSGRHESCSASGIRSRGSASTSASTATGRSAPPIPGRCPTPASWTSIRRRPPRFCSVTPDLSNAQHLRYELTALAYHLKEQGAGVRDRVGDQPWRGGQGARSRGWRPGIRLHRACHWAGRRTRSRVRARVRGRPRRRGRDQSDHRQRRDARSVQGLFRRHLHASAGARLRR